MRDELLSLAYKRWKLRQIAFDLPTLRIEKLTKLACRSEYCSWLPDEVVLHIQNSEEAFSLAESLAYLGKCSKVLVRTLQPAFCLRILELSEEEFLYYHQLSDLLRERLAVSYALKTLSLGYNALLLRSKAKFFQGYLLSCLREISSKARLSCVQFGLDITDFTQEDRHDLVAILSEPSVDFFFHAHVESLFGDNESLLPQEALLEGVIWLRTIVQVHVIIIVQTSSEMVWSESSLVHLLSVFPERSLLAFEAYLPVFSTQEHPIWSLLQQDLIGGKLPILPIFQGGSLPYGQGIWPIFPGLHWDPLLRLAKQLQFPAICVFSDHFPSGNGFLACSLWCLGQACWTDWPLFSLYSYWLHFHFPEWNLPVEWAQLVHALARTAMTILEKPAEKEWVVATLERIREHEVEDLKLKTYLSSFIEDIHFLLQTDGSFEGKKWKLLHRQKKTFQSISPFSIYALILSENGMHY
ncbi:hypothetical protein [Candidatus Similichlamydia laticola]|uniref:Uncharacterized protein n=1 Tax=Candidatus Similichlamydia laticola TaxID=2170265 RepID=A0A369KA01_9BACT|nr:hypothetical protein [Candidatus Similichlamydia laticola]RDB31421.1 hypothetical protein HAT2_00474 [Candidatus Similichlamydia laticola]